MKYLLPTILLAGCVPATPPIHVHERPWLNPALSYSSVVDAQGNVYATVTIGGREWMAEDLRSTHYQNADSIPSLTDSSSWVMSRTGGAAVFSNDAGRRPPFGLLYNGYAVLDPRNVCPAGWHVPTDAEWRDLEQAAGMPAWATLQADIRGEDRDIGSALKARIGWDTLNGSSTNSLGFSGLPGGMHQWVGGYQARGQRGSWWTSTSHGVDSVWTRTLPTPLYAFLDPVVGDTQIVVSDKVGVFREPASRTDGRAVRCIKDLPAQGTPAWDLDTPTNDRTHIPNPLHHETAPPDPLAAAADR
jgi:uncharacterized protein (TIGR02145 family)